jgi:hypothetical protein
MKRFLRSERCFANSAFFEKTPKTLQNILPRNYETRPGCQNRQMDDNGRARDDREKINFVIGLARCVASFSPTVRIGKRRSRATEAHGIDARTESTFHHTETALQAAWARLERCYGMYGASAT